MYRQLTPAGEILLKGLGIGFAAMFTISGIVYLFVRPKHHEEFTVPTTPIQFAAPAGNPVRIVTTPLVSHTAKQPADTKSFTPAPQPQAEPEKQDRVTASTKSDDDSSSERTYTGHIPQPETSSIAPLRTTSVQTSTLQTRSIRTNSIKATGISTGGNSPAPQQTYSNYNVYPGGVATARPTYQRPTSPPQQYRQPPNNSSSSRGSVLQSGNLTARPMRSNGSSNTAQR
jgi:hypothetical protein